MATTEGKKSGFEAVKEFYRLYTTGLSRAEIERLLKQESLDIFSYYKATVNGRPVANDRVPASAGDTWVDVLARQSKVVLRIFLSFVLKLTPARRLFYGVAILLFGFALVVSSLFYAFIAFLLVNSLLAFELADKLLAKDELEIAREIQLSLQPELPVVPGVQLSAFYRPAKEVGGDFYDLIRLGDNRVAVVLGDVSGKGLPAALYAVKLQGYFELMLGKTASPKEMLTAINELVSRRLKRQFFITSLVAIVDRENSNVQLARAGHNPMLHYSRPGRKTDQLTPRGCGLGLQPNQQFAEEIEDCSVQLAEGDVLVFYTDGITEAMNASRVQFGEERLAGLVSSHAGHSAEEIKNAIITSLTAFVQRAFFDDDAALIVLKLTS